MAPHHSQKRNWSEAARSQDDGAVGLKGDGSGVNLNWKALIGIIVAACLAFKWCVGIETASQSHTEALAVQAIQIRHVNAKVNALLYKAGLDPGAIVKASDQSDSPAN
jgi:hypothetical protein